MAGTAPLCSLLHSPYPQLNQFPFNSHKHHNHQQLLPVHISTPNHDIKQNQNPKITICNSKMNNNASSLREESTEEIDGVYFHGDDEIEDESDDDDEEEEDDDERENSVDLLVRFVKSLFKKLSKRAKKATRSILPPAISPQLVSFAVDGVLVLTLLSIVKALLEVVCTLGGTVFVVILLLRAIWATTSHFQANGNNMIQNGSSSYGSTQPAT